VAKLSVVVPFYNVEAYLEAALESIARQTLADLEVILVDDGSSDESTPIAKSYVSRDPRFHLIQQKNTGLGPARNAGIRHASGEYLAFADSDDLVSPHAYAVLTGSLDKTGSDIATGAVRRLTAVGPTPSRLHEGPFRKTVLRTHVSRFPSLMADRGAWNKVYRRSFWDANGFEFPAGTYEDAPVTVRAHVLASSVDVLADVVYYWRLRESGELSITERYREIGNIEQRMATVADVGGFLAARAPALKAAYDRSVLRSDIRLLVQACEFVTDEDRARIAEIAAGYLRTVDPSVYAAVPISDRLRGYLLGQQKLPELLEVLRYERSGEAGASPVVRREGGQGRWCARYPFYGDPAHGIPDDMYDITGEMALNAGVDSVGWHGGKLRIEGHAYIARLSSATPSECTIRVTLRNSKTRRTIRLPLKRVRRPDVTARSEQASVSYDWSGFVTEIAARRLATLPGVWRGANWELMVEVSGGGLRREGPNTSVAPGSAQWPEGRWVSGDVWLQPAPEHDGRFVIRGQQVGACVTACTAGEGVLHIEGWTTQPLSAGATLVATPRQGGLAAIRVPAEPAPAGGHKGRHTFRARIPGGLLAGPPDASGPIDRMIHVHDESTWDLSLSPGTADVAARLSVAPATASARLAHDGREITTFATHFGALSLLERTLRLVVTGLEWTSDQHLVMRGDYTGPLPGPAELTLRHVRSGRQHHLALRWEGNVFTTEFAPAEATGLAGQAGTLPLANGDWHVLAPTGPAGTTVVVALDRRLLPSLPGYHLAGLHEVEARPYNTDALRLHVRLARADDERGPYAVRQLGTHYYPQACARPLRELAVFDCFSGRTYCCNPRAIHDELRRTRPDLECAWITRQLQFGVPEGTRLIPTDSRAHFEALAQARYVIVNDGLPRWFRRREGQTCLQTWHGTPLKRIGLDIARPQFDSGLIYPDLIREEAANWDLLLSPNAFSTPIFQRAFGYGGEILECGSPRNDALHLTGQEQRAAAIRGRLGLPAGKQIVLYAPTWRDDAARPSGGGYRFDLRLDLPAMADALADDHVLLLRLHPNASNSPNAHITSGFVTPVTHYPDITDLLLISDVLITDYSSVMFDFAGTGRPILFYAYDLEKYRDNLRGFYFDLESQAPGPLLDSTADVIDALRDTASIERSYRAAYQAFASTYCALDDGGAAARVVRRLLRGR
jgi:CDP-glycerol glycerophosphotransferase